MNKRIGLIGAATAVAVTGALATSAMPASAKTILSNCQGAAVKRCAGVGNPSGDKFKAWANITDNQKDSANYTVWVTNLTLQAESSNGTWHTLRSSKDADGHFVETESANTATYTCPGGVGSFMILRSRATFHWQKVGSSKVDSATMGSGAVQANCK